MNRCAQLTLALSLAGALAALAPAPASAQDGQAVPRKFPRTALRGRITFGAPPAITLNGQATSLAPGFRIHGLNNLIMMSTELVGTTVIVDYTSDLQGQPFELWLLSAAEVAVQPWPYTAYQAGAWTFDPVAQTWTKP